VTSQDDPNWGWEFHTEDFVFARLEEDAEAAQELPDSVRSHALAINAGMRGILAEHSIYVRDDQSAGRCYTCSPIHGVPCTTLLALARIWRSHPDAPQWLAQDGNHPDPDVVRAGTWRRLTWPQTVDMTGPKPTEVNRG